MIAKKVLKDKKTNSSEDMYMMKISIIYKLEHFFILNIYFLSYTGYWLSTLIWYFLTSNVLSLLMIKICICLYLFSPELQCLPNALDIPTSILHNRLL